MKVAITDVSVLFDLYNVGVLPEFFGLDLEIYTTDFIYNEILHSAEKNEFEIFVRSGQLKIIVVEDNERLCGVKVQRRNGNNSPAVLRSLNQITFRI